MKPNLPVTKITRKEMHYNLGPFKDEKENKTKSVLNKLLLKDMEIA